MSLLKILTIFGTRPEAIKIAPVLKQLARLDNVESKICVTGQHRHMLDQMLNLFEISPDVDLSLMRRRQSLTSLTSSSLTALDQVIADFAPDRILVHGDTTTSFVAALAAFYANVPVGHVEAGLRTGDLHSPWPEEFNRRSVDLISDLRWAPTQLAADNLLNEGADPSSVFVTGNTAIDALGYVVDRLDSDRSLRARANRRLTGLSTSKRLILVTCHRREQLSERLVQVCRAVDALSRRPDVQVVWPVHPNPAVHSIVYKALGGRETILLTPPLSYAEFIAAMRRCYLILTDSGGIQEEAPSLGKPVLVARTETERPEAIHAGCARLVGLDSDRIVAAAVGLLDDPKKYRTMSNVANPYGTGNAAELIVSSILEKHQTALVT